MSHGGIPWGSFDFVTAQYWPVGGTMIAALRWGKLAAPLSGAKWDVVDDDLEFFVSLDSENEWMELTSILTQALTHHPDLPARFCHNTFSLHTNVNFWSNYVRQDLLACGWFKPHAMGLELRSYVRWPKFNIAYTFRMGGSGYEWCDERWYLQHKAWKWMVFDGEERARLGGVERAEKAVAAAATGTVDDAPVKGGATARPAEEDGAPVMMTRAKTKRIMADIELRHGGKIFGINPWWVRTSIVPEYVWQWHLNRKRRRRASERKRRFEKGGAEDAGAAVGAPARVAEGVVLPADALSPNWKEATDPTSGKTYYWNTVDKSTSWERPTTVRKAESENDF